MKKIKKIGSALLAVIIMLTYALFLENTKPKFKASQVLQSTTPEEIDDENVLGAEEDGSGTWKHYFLGNSDQEFNGKAGHSGLKIADGAKVVIDLCGHELIAIGGNAPDASTTQEGGIGGGAGIWVPESSTLVFVGKGKVIAKGGKGGNGNNGSNGNGVSFDSYGSGYYYANPDNINSGQGGAGGGGGGGAGAGIGTPGGPGGKGGAQTGRLSIGRWAKSTVQYTNLLYNNGEDGGDADQKMGNLYVLGTIKVNAIGGDAGDSGGAGGVTSGHNVAVYTRIDATLSNSDWTEVSASVGSGGAGGGAGHKGAPIGTGGGGGGGGASGYSGGTTCYCPINDTHPNNIVSSAAARAWIVQSLVANGMGMGPKNGTMNSHNAISQPIYGYRSIGGSSSDWSYGGEYYGTNPVAYYTYSEGGFSGKQYTESEDKVKEKVIITASTSEVICNKEYESNPEGIGIQLPFTDYNATTTLKLPREGYEVKCHLYSDNTPSAVSITATAAIGNTALTLPDKTTVHTREGYTLQGYYTRKYYDKEEGKEKGGDTRFYKWIKAEI